MSPSAETADGAANAFTTADARRIAEWNDTRKAYPTDRCLHELVEAQVDRDPEAIALRHEGEEMSYRELEARANRVAAALREVGVGPDTLVGVCLERSPDLVIALLAVLKAGGAYVPLDPEYPPDRLGFMAEDSGVSAILTHREAMEAIPPSAADTAVLLRVDEIAGDEAGAERVAGDIHPGNLAYVMYTSGSTGRPKGVMVEHRSITNRLHWMQDHYGIGPHDVLIQKTPFSFDVSVWEFFWPLMAGACLEVVRAGGHKDAGHLARVVEDAGVTVMHFVPSMLDLFLETSGVSDRCGSLEHVICSGEALPRDLVDRFYRLMPPGATLWNLYGPTEAAVDVTWWRCEPGSTDNTVPIGRPVGNTRIQVVDDDAQPLPAGEVGELVICGVQVARGYWNRPELTREKFISEPGVAPASVGGSSAGEVPAEHRAYRTGDLARWRDDGALEFLGRVDHQVKIRGQRVELGEIEALLRQQDPVLQAAVVLLDDPDRGQRLVAYVVLQEGRPLDESALRSAMAAELPEVMVPSRFVALDEMPLSPNGKLDRGALPEPGRLRPELGTPYTEPRNPVEAFLADLWKEILGLDRVGIHDPFFELGGSSLHAARVVNRLQDELDAFLYVVTLFDAPTVAEYASFLERDYRDALEGRFQLSSFEQGGPPAGAAGPPSSGKRASRTPVSETHPRAADEEELRRLDEAVPRFPLAHPSGKTDREKNEPAVFILAPPRSGTTLLRVMLAGHPDLFAAAELQLLHFESLGQRREAFTGKYEAWLDGVIRTLMEIDDVGPDQAKAAMAEREERDLEVGGFYAEIQERLAGRLLVEKTPSYALDPNALQRAERDFRDARYVHLVRHPYAMVESFVSYHMEQILYLHEHPFDPRRLGELVWTLSHRNVEAFLDGIPEGRKHRLRFEDMVRDPDAAMRRFAHHLGIPFRESLTRPYEDLSSKMVDGVHDDSTPMGDTRLLERDRIDPSVADKWKGVLDDDYLGEPTWAQAERLGYDRIRTAAAGSGASGEERGPAESGGRPSTPDGEDRSSTRRQALRQRRMWSRKGSRATGPSDDGEEA